MICTVLYMYQYRTGQTVHALHTCYRTHIRPSISAFLQQAQRRWESQTPSRSERGVGYAVQYSTYCIVRPVQYIQYRTVPPGLILKFLPARFFKIKPVGG